MTEKIKKQKLNRLSVLFIFLLSSLFVNAQTSWDWDDCVEWLRYSGFKTMSVYAHPTNDMKKFSVSQSSPDVIVKIYYDGTFVDFDATYKIVRGYHNGMPYFSDVKVLNEDVLIGSFTAWKYSPKLHRMLYEDLKMSYLYGVEDWNDLSLGKKVASALMMEFLKTRL